jgi:hypothetical protein
MFLFHNLFNTVYDIFIALISQLNNKAAEGLFPWLRLPFEVAVG